jgi:spore maturation protein CgeB
MTFAASLSPEGRINALRDAARRLQAAGRPHSALIALEQAAQGSEDIALLQEVLYHAERGHAPSLVRNISQRLATMYANNGDRTALESLTLRRLTQGGPARELPRIAAIVDEFTATGLWPDCHFLALDPELATQQIDGFKPELLFVESAWHGNDGRWTRRILHPDNALRDTLAHCRKRNVPTVFWNKEDPVHFHAFLETARLFDHVFTTDIDCIPAYRQALGHDRVHLLPFAVQPLRFSPIETHQRKNTACFAGSFYRQFPDRQRAFSDLVSTVETQVPVEIFDRRLGDGLDHYVFPDRFQSMIQGRLNFDEIDKAYKGSKFGLNINTITQSQTMLSRRVLELMASNTVVLSNPARGLRVLLGDLVLGSAGLDTITRTLPDMVRDDTAWRRFRLQGLRRVLEHHTWVNRLRHIMAVLGLPGIPHEIAVPIGLIAKAPDARALVYILDAFGAQTHAARHLFILCDQSTAKEGTANRPLPSDASLYHAAEDLVSAVLARREDFAFWGGMHPDDHYGPNYLTDLALGDRFAPGAAGFFKGGAHRIKGGTLHPGDTAEQYRPLLSGQMRSGILRAAFVDTGLIADMLKRPAKAQCRADFGLLALDPFNHCLDGAHDEAAIAATSDPAIPDRGLSIDRLYALAKTLPATSPRPIKIAEQALRITAEEFDAHSLVQRNMPIVKRLESDELVVTSHSKHDKPVYLWLTKPRPRIDLGLVEHSTACCDLVHDTRKVQLAIEFFDAPGKALGRAVIASGKPQAFPIPDACTLLRFGLRIFGAGEVRFREIRFGPETHMPPLVIAKSPRLLVTRRGPKWTEADAELRAWLANQSSEGPIDVFLLGDMSGQSFERIDGIEFARGDLALLDATLGTGQYETIILHAPDPETLSLAEQRARTLAPVIWTPGLRLGRV